MIRILSVCPESFGANTYLLISGTHALVVDPAVTAQAITAAASAEGAWVEGILLTHGHFDHIVSLDTVRDALKIPAMIHEEDAPMLTDGKKNAFTTFFGKERAWRPAEILLQDGAVIPLGEDQITVLHTPGHSPGSVCYCFEGGMVTGDTLFSDNVGRSDLWGGSEEILADSLKKLGTLDGTLDIYPGHGTKGRLSDALRCVAYYF